MWELSEQQLKELGDLFIDFYKKKLREEIYPYGNPNARGVGHVRLRVIPPKSRILRP